MRIIVLLSAFWCAVATLSGADTRLTMTGSSSVAPLVSEIARRFETKHPGVRIDVQTGGSTRGLTDARAGRADIGMASRAMTAEEADLIAYPIAVDGIACIVHRSNPVTMLSKEQVTGIFSGTITNWSAVGGPDRRIVVVNKAAGRSTLELFLHHFALKADQIKAEVVIGDNAQGIKTVAGSADAIGYVSIGAAQTDADAGVAIKVVGLDGRVPSIDTVRDGTWPIIRPLNLVMRSAPTGVTAEFVAFARSAAVDDLILDLAFVAPPR
jgi:phosphate transport system substrate-binding protein